MRITSMGLGDASCHEAGDTGGIEEGRVIYKMVVVGVDAQAQELLGDDVEGIAPSRLEPARIEDVAVDADLYVAELAAAVCEGLHESLGLGRGGDVDEVAGLNDSDGLFGGGEFGLVDGLSGHDGMIRGWGVGGNGGKTPLFR